VHAEGGQIALQILHAGRYAFHERLVAPSALKAPINAFRPRALSEEGVERQIADYARCARLAREAGYDGVEIMGSEGYLINQFTAAKTNRRDDRWGGPFANRMRFPVEIVRRVRQALGADYLVIYRLSMLDLVKGGSTWEEVVALARAVAAAGATLINTGIGWHESRVPTIAAVVPRGAFTWVTARLRAAVDVPLVASNRINTPELAETVLARGDAELVSMARPFLADPDFLAKARQGRSDAINTCIACNQACLDRIFELKVATCLVNPRACRETEFDRRPADPPRRIAVLGAGPAGLSLAVTAARRGHSVTLFERAPHIGGQLALAKSVPGKEEFAETLRYFGVALQRHGVDLRLGHAPSGAELAADGFEAVVLATGVTPRIPPIEGIGHPKVLTYAQALADLGAVGERVAIIGAGGIGIDVAVALTHDAGGDDGAVKDFLTAWGVDRRLEEPGGLVLPGPRPALTGRRVTLMQRKPEKIGRRLGKTTGWIHRGALAAQGVELLSGVAYRRIDDRGLWVVHRDRERLLAVDHVIVCAGQKPRSVPLPELVPHGIALHAIGGAQSAERLDALRAIEAGLRLGEAI
jgi:2,4-dienoyl-CoA reductase (NADPH2)